MPPEVDFYWTSLSTQSCLLECDTELVKDALYFILNSADKQPAPAETVQIALALNSYINECNNAFLASERMRLFLLLSLIASLIIAFTALAILPVSTLSITLVCIVSFILFSVNLFTLCNQMSAYQQEIDWNKLKRSCQDYSKKFKSRYCQNTPSKSISSPTSAPCLFPTRNIPRNDEANTHRDNACLNQSEHGLSPLNEELCASSYQI